jgi:septal ring factor EnvC (AmiA/AmiB activator)
VAEQQLLAIEDPIRQLVMELEVPAVFDQGYTAALNEARIKVQQQQQALIAARQANRDREQDIADLKREATELKARLGGESEERQSLLKKLSAQERQRESIARIESLFTADEGRVYRQGAQLIMSLNAIAFRSGKSTIEPSSFPVLAKVNDAIALFPPPA